MAAMRVRRAMAVKMCFLAAVCCLALAGGCATKQSGGPQGGAPLLALPDDDKGEPLSPRELAALQTTGHVDKDIPAEAMPDVARQYKYFLRKGRPTMSVFSRRAEQYRTHARTVFRSRGMPEELAYLAIVESGYRADAKSPAGAMGAWQFMPRTGQQYGLTQDWWTDERLDPYASTEAAADYLQKLHGDFGDWATAVAAYNAGEGKIGRARQGTGGKNFYEVKARNHMLDDKAQLREETKQYVPRFMAVSKIMRNLPQLGFEAINPESAPAVLRITARSGTDLRGLAGACNMRWDEFASYNMHHKRPITDTGRPTFVYVPARSEKEALAYLRSPQCAAFAGWGAMTVASDADSWEKISRRCNVPETQLRALNPGRDRLRSGDMVLLPRSVNMSAKAVAAQDVKPGGGKALKSSDKPVRGGGAAGQAPARAVAAGGAHTLQTDETLYAVARKYGVSIKELQEHNKIDNPNLVRAGAVLRIPGRGAGPAVGGASGKVGSPAKTVYTVQARDSLWKIARQHNVSVDDLKRWNSVDEKSLRAGATLVVEQ